MRVRGEAQDIEPDAWVQELTQQFTQLVQERAISWETNELAAPPVAELVDRLTALLPPAAPSILDAEIGPFYDTAGVQTLLGGVTKQAVAARRDKHTILAVKTSDGRWIYPTFQFTGQDVDSALVPAIRAFENAPAWSTALWFVTPNPDLEDDRTPLDWVRAGEPADAIENSARRTAREWR
jgi:hypothetical protein